MEKVKKGIGCVVRKIGAGLKRIGVKFKPVGVAFHKAEHRLSEIHSKYFYNPLVLNAVIAVVMNIYIETISRHSLIESARFFIENPWIFVLNVVIIFATYGITVLFRRKLVWYIIITALWFAIGTVNGIVLLNRLTPFNVKDLANIEEAKAIATNYLSTPLLVIIIIAAVAVIAGLVLLVVIGPKGPKLDYRKALLNFALVVVLLLVTWNGAIKLNVVSTYFENLPYAYRDNGVPYCFTSTWLITGIDKPEDYSEEMIQEDIFTKGELGEDGTYQYEVKDVDDEYPNILFLQLESFIDPTILEGFEYSQDPVPNFRALMEEYSSGMMTVPSVGAGTANVEFEAMTGISARFFGPGEYPYKSVLLEETCESIPYDLKNLGFSTHAIHNHRGAFYGRNEVFKNLGFDTFTSLEYMQNVEKTAKNWAKDGLLTQHIIDAMKSTDTKDYVYTISVQGHGKYPEEQVLEDPAITLTEYPDEETRWQYEYYVNQIYEMDQFVAELVAALEEFDEDVILVVYGDHLPALEVDDDNVTTGDMFMTQYFIWDNMGMEKEDANLTTYEVGSEVLDRLGIHEGLMTTYQQNYKGTSNYMENMEALAYDMLYGEKYIYGGKTIFQPTDLKMGIYDIKIDEIVQIGDDWYIKGQNFTEYSKVSLDGKPLKTVFLGPTLLGLKEEVDPDRVADMKISQVEKNDVILSTTE